MSVTPGTHLDPVHDPKQDLAKVSDEKADIAEYQEGNRGGEHENALAWHDEVDITLEERVFYADAQRRTYGMHTGQAGAPKEKWFHWFHNVFGPLDDSNVLAVGESTEAKVDYGAAADVSVMPTFEREKTEARRALRKAGWVNVFFLLTTDVLGPFNAPFAYSQTGFVGGTFLYLTFGIAAFYSSWIVLNLYLRLDSDRYPIRTFGDLMFAMFGKFGKYFTMAIQAFQLYFISSLNVLGAGQSLSLLAKGNLCFIVCIVIFAVAPFLLELPFRDLSKLSYVCSLSVFINYLTIFLTMGFVAHSAPNYEAAAAAYGYTAPFAPVSAEAVVSTTLSQAVNGAGNMIYGWSGILLYIEFMNEMYRPADFWKSFTWAELIILLAYVVYGSYFYAFQGQYTLGLSYQGLSVYSWASIGNGMSLWTQLVAATLYANVGLKIIYWWLQQFFPRMPNLNSKGGWYGWWAINIVSWPIIFVIAAAIPQIQTLSALIASAFLLQFSYTFPPLLQFAFDLKADASRLDSAFVPGEPVKRYDTWRSMARWRRGLFTGRVWFKAFNLAYLLAAIALCGLGIWGSAEAIKVTFENGAATSCVLPEPAT